MADAGVAGAGAGRDRVTIAGSFACALVAAVVVVHGDLSGTAPTWYLVADVAGGAAACAALWLSRRWPATVALAVVAMSVPSAAASCAAGVATLIAALHRRSAVAIGVGAAWVAATLIRFWLRPPGLAPYPVWALVAVLFGAALTGWGMLARARRQLVSSLVERARRAEEEQRGRAEQARRDERLAIAREMHDVLAHRLSLLALHAGALEFNARADPGEVVEAASVVRASAHQALQELRQVISVLREAPVLAELDLPALIAEVRRAGMEVEIRDGGVRLPDLPGATARAAYRIVQEGLTNARKHAPGRPVSVRLEGSPDEGLTVEVRNPATGTPGPEGVAAGMQGGEATGPAGTRGGEGAALAGSWVSEGAGLSGTQGDEGADQTGRPRIGGTAGTSGIEGAGLAGVRERAELAGGRVERAGVEAGEFRLAVWLPWPV